MYLDWDYLLQVNRVMNGNDTNQLKNAVVHNREQGNDKPDCEVSRKPTYINLTSELCFAENVHLISHYSWY